MSEETKFHDEVQDDDYDLWCDYWDIQKEQLRESWGVETWEELEALGHDW